MIMLCSDSGTVVTVVMAFLSPPFMFDAAICSLDSERSELLQKTYGLQLTPQACPPRTIDCSSFRKSHIPHFGFHAGSRRISGGFDWVTMNVLKSRRMTTQANSGYISWMLVYMKIAVHAKTSFTRYI